LEVKLEETASKGLIKPSPYAAATTVDLKKQTEPFTLSGTVTKLQSLVPANDVPFLVNRYVLGIGQQDGELVIHFSNNLKSTANVTVLFSSPWPVRFYFHTLKGLLSSPNLGVSELSRDYFKILSLLPSEDRGRPAQLELSFSLHSQHALTLTLQFDRVFLHFAEHPPDPHRGYDIGSTIVEVAHSDKTVSSSYASPILIVTSGHSIMLPTPDFSMMYNVITLTCTVVAMFYGQALNLMARRLSEVYTKSGEFISNRPLARLLRRFLSRGNQADDEPLKKTKKRRGEEDENEIRSLL
jgi:phosphatidylinositol glycan class T